MSISRTSAAVQEALSGDPEARPVHLFRERVGEQYDRLTRTARRDDPVVASARHWLRETAMRMAMVADYEEQAEHPERADLPKKLARLEDALVALQELMARYGAEAAAGCPPDAGWAQARSEVGRFVQQRLSEVRALQLRHAE